MEANLSSPSFELTGTFGGFVYTAAGKRRMMLRTDKQVYLLKIPRLLRRQVIGKFRAGQTLEVAGSADRDGSGAVTKRTVERITAGGTVHGTPELRRVACTINICAKKNCWRSGGREVMAGLKDEFVTCGLDGTVEVKAVNCLDRCPMAPNVDSPWREYRRVNKRDAAAIVAEVAERLAPTARV